LIEGVLVDAPEALVDALGELGDGRLALVASADDGDGEAFAPTSLAAKVQGPRAIRRLLSRLHVADTLADARACRRSWAMASRSSPAMANAWAPAGCAWCVPARPSRARCCARREIQSLRGEIDGCSERERELEALLTRLRDQLLAAEQQREDAQRALYLAHRGVSELAGQLQSQQGKLESARNRIERIDAELAQLAEARWTASASRRARRASGSRCGVGAWAIWKPPGRRWTPSAASWPRPAMPHAWPPANRATPRTRWR
jgi:chromosome segregation protein